LAFMSPVGEEAVLAALPVERRPLVTLAVNTGLRWSEQARLRWHDVDLLTGVLTVRLAKNGHVRRVPINSAARSALLDLAAQRVRPADPEEIVSRGAYRPVSRDFIRAVAAAQVTLRAAGQESEAARLDGETWHALRHTFASRLVAAGVDLRTVQELGGWKTLSMVQRYAHPSPNHLVAAIEKIVAVPAVAASEAVNVREHRQNFDSAENASREIGVRH
jgi:site-specific recombinase XerD